MTRFHVIIVLVLLSSVMVCTAIAAPLPERIISGAPNFTEMLFALGLGDRVIGVTDFCRFPPEAGEREKIGGYLNPNLEKIISLSPDLVILPKTKRDLTDRLVALNINSLLLPNETISDALDAIVSIASASGVPRRGRSLKKRIERELQAVKNRYAQTPPVRTFICVARSPGTLKDLYGAAPGTFLNELLVIAGGENILEKSIPLYPKISKESLVVMNPGVILDATYSGRELTTSTVQTVLDPWKALPAIDAVKQDRVYMITDPAITVPGPRMARSARSIAGMIHRQEER